jgi:hypothetical protein
MSDKELIQQRIDELEENIKNGHQTGKTYRVINKIIDDLFNMPIGTQIDVNDEKDDVKELVNKLSLRLIRDFPETDFKIVYPAPGVVKIIRLSETYQEIAKKRLKQWQNKLKEME